MARRKHVVLCRTANYPCWLVVADSPSEKEALSQLRVIRRKMRQAKCRGVLRVLPLSQLPP